MNQAEKEWNKNILKNEVIKDPILGSKIIRCVSNH
jgi:hypothetical protein